MDGNRAKKAPVLDHLVGALNASTRATPDSVDKNKTTNLPLWASANNNGEMNGAMGNSPDTDNSPAGSNGKSTEPSPSLPQNRHTDKSKFELELTQTVHKIMLKHFEHASEEIVQQVLNEVRARLPGQRKP